MATRKMAVTTPSGNKYLVRVLGVYGPDARVKVSRVVHVGGAFGANKPGSTFGVAKRSLRAVR